MDASSGVEVVPHSLDRILVLVSLDSWPHGDGSTSVGGERPVKRV